MTDVYGFFYILVVEHTGRIIFGITKSAFDRIDDYTAHTGMAQAFTYLFWGQYDEIVKIEKNYKKLNRSKLLTVIRRRGKWKMESLDPAKCNDTAEDVKVWVHDYISKNSLEVKSIQQKWLPYRGDPCLQTVNISYDKEYYLDI